VMCGTRIRNTRLLIHLVDSDISPEGGESCSRCSHGVKPFQSVCAIGLESKHLVQFKRFLAMTTPMVLVLRGHVHEIFPNVINNIRLAPVGGSEQRDRAPTARSGSNSGH
jgi:hypothetical protein